MNSVDFLYPFTKLNFLFIMMETGSVFYFHYLFSFSFVKTLTPPSVSKRKEEQTKQTKSKTKNELMLFVKCDVQCLMPSF